MTKTVAIVITVLLVHTAAAHAQQSPSPAQQDPGEMAQQALPPAYAPPPGYAPPASQPPAPPPPPPSPPPVYATPAPPAYGPPPPAYGPPAYGPPAYGPPPRYASPYYYPPPAPPPRAVLDRPFMLGGGIGFGGLSFTDRTTGDHFHANDGFAYTFRLGFGLRPGLLLMWDVEGTLVERNATTISQTAHLAALQLFPCRRLFFKAGLGLAQVVQDNFPSEWGGAGMVGIGYELVQGWNWSFDIEATATAARYNNNSVGGDQTWANWSLVNFAINFF
jgi:hypothetical protein